MRKDTPGGARFSGAFRRTIGSEDSSLSPRSMPGAIGRRDTIRQTTSSENVQEGVSHPYVSPFSAMGSGDVLPSELPRTDLPTASGQSHDDSPFSLTLQDAATGHYAMPLPPRWRIRDFIPLVQGNGGPDDPPGKPPRMGIGRVWSQDDQLHVVGPHAKRVLNQLTNVAVLLRELGVGSPQEPGFLEVLQKIPALLVVSGDQPQLRPVEKDGDSSELHADPEWVSCVLSQLTTHWPSLACRLFLLLTPKRQYSLVRHCPSVIGCMVDNLSTLPEQQALGAVFEAGLKDQLRSGNAASSFLPWLMRCPPWAAASLLEIWDAYDHPKEKQWWLHQCPQLAEALSVLGDMARPMRQVEPPSSEAALDILRKCGGVRWEGSNTWALAIKLIRDEVRQLVSDKVADHALNDCYGRIVEISNLMPADKRTDALLYSVMQELSEQLQRKGVQEARMDWLLNKIFLNAKRVFSQAAAIAFQHLCDSPTPDVRQLRLKSNTSDAFAVVDCPDPVHLRWILQAMVQLAGREEEFQKRMTLNKKTARAFKDLLGTGLFGAVTPLQGQEAPANLAQAHWRMKLTYRHELAEQLASRESQPPTPKKSVLARLSLVRPTSKAPLVSRVQLDLMASILQGAAHDTQTPIRPEEMALLASYISDASYSLELLNWLTQLLERHVDDPKYVECVSSMVLNAVAQLYASGGPESQARKFADALMAWLCLESRVPVRFDTRFAGESLLSCSAWTTNTVIRLQRALSAANTPESRRAAQRACVWITQLSMTLDPHSTSKERQALVMYLREQLAVPKKFNLLNAEERSILAFCRGLYANEWQGPYTLWTDEDFNDEAMEEMRNKSLDGGKNVVDNPKDQGDAN